MKTTIITAFFALCLLGGCTIHERDYYEEVHVPQIKPDTIVIDNWSDNKQKQDTL